MQRALGSNTATPYTHRSPAPILQDHGWWPLQVARFPSVGRVRVGQLALHVAPTVHGCDPSAALPSVGLGPRLLGPFKRVSSILATPLGDTTAFSRGGSSSRPWIATLSRVTCCTSVECLVQATTMRSVAPLTFALGLESCPKSLGPKFVGFAPQVFRVCASDHLSSPSDDSRFPRMNGGEHCAASATQMAASTTLPMQRERW